MQAPLAVRQIGRGALVAITLLCGCRSANSQAPDAAGDSPDAVIGDGRPPADAAPDAELGCVSAGTPDPSFGVSGFAPTIFAPAPVGRNSAAASVVIEPVSSRILVAGGSPTPDGYDGFAVVRLLANGSLDSSFGMNGISVTGIRPFDCSLEDIALQSDGKLVGVGSIAGPDSARVAIVRYQTNGSLDTSFGTDGFVVLQLAPFGHALAVAIDVDDHIVVAAHSWTGLEPPIQSYFTTFRLRPDGTLDPYFGVGGVAESAFQNGLDLAFDLILQADGRIVVVGSAATPGRSDFGVVRYTPAGVRDATFGSAGLAIVNFGDSGSKVNGVTLDPQGRTVLVGPVGGTRAGLARLTAEGHPDVSFGASGTVVATTAPNGLALRKAVVSSDGKILAAGWSTLAPGNALLALARYQATGAPDLSFGPDGISLSSSGTMWSSANDLALQPDGRIVVAGWRGPPAKDFLVARYCP